VLLLCWTTRGSTKSISLFFYDNFAALIPGGTIHTGVAIQSINYLIYYKNRQLPNYDELRAAVTEDLNKATGQTGVKENVVRFIGEAQYGKLTFLIPGFTGGRKLKNIVKLEMEKKYQQGQTQFAPATDMFSIVVPKTPVFKAINKTKGRIDSYDILPSFLNVVVPFLDEQGYDTSEMQHSLSSQEEPGAPGTTESVPTLLAASLDEAGSVIINFGGYPGADIIEATKRSGFRYQGSNTHNWLVDDPDKNKLKELADLLTQTKRYDISQLLRIIEQLERTEGTRDYSKFFIRIRDVSKETEGLWHLGVKFLQRGTYEGETLKKIIRFSFIKYGELDDAKAGRSTNKETWESYLKGTYQEYVNFYNSLKNRGFDTSKLEQILQNLVKEGLVKQETGVGQLDGYASKEEFFKELEKYSLPFELYEQQKEAIATLYGHRSYLDGSDTGAGKTVLSTLAADMRLKQTGGRAVIVTKTAAQDQFLGEVQKFLGLSPEEISDDPFARKKWTVLNYHNFSTISQRKEITAELIRQAQTGEVQVLVLDESHTVKNGNPRNRDNTGQGDHKSNYTTFNIQDISQHVPNVWGLSATIVANKPIDVYNQLKAINHPLGKMTWGKFAVEFGGMVTEGRGLVPGPIEHQIEKVNELKEFLFDQHAYGALYKKDLNKDLPDQIIGQKDIDVDQNALWTNVREKLNTFKNPELPVSAMIAFRNEVAIRKAQQTASMAGEILQQGKKVMIFTDFKDSKNILKDEIQNILNQRGRGEVTTEIVGGMHRKTREKNKAAFKDLNSNARAIIINIVAGGTGLDFPNVTTDVFVNDFDWSVAQDEQMLGRAYRVNSEEDVNVTYVIANDTPDQDYYDKVKDKKRVADVIHKMSQKQDNLMGAGHRRGLSDNLDGVEITLNAAKKQMAEMEETEAQSLNQIARKIQRNVGRDTTAQSGNWWEKIN